MKIVKRITDVRILVIGDIMLDKYVIGKVERISAEAPVPIVHVTKEYSTLGGSGNVINNISSLGANVSCIMRHGEDADAWKITEHLIDIKCDTYNIVDKENPTIVKERIIADGQQVQMLRVDREKITPCSAASIIKILDEILKGNKPDIIVISDYAKGMVTKDLMDYLSKLNIKIIIDPKPSNMEYYKNAYMITPNNDEYWKMIKVFHCPLVDEVCEYVLHTKGKDGMTLYDNKVTSPFMNGKDIKSNPVKVFNVTGAGDTVVSVMAICTALGIDPFTSAKIANECAEYVVTQPGTSIVPKELFDEIITKMLLN